jgi:hypothetical protein
VTFDRFTTALLLVPGVVILLRRRVAISPAPVPEEEPLIPQALHGPLNRFRGNLREDDESRLDEVMAAHPDIVGQPLLEASLVDEGESVSRSILKYERLLQF